MIILPHLSPIILKVCRQVLQGLGMQLYVHVWHLGFANADFRARYVHVGLSGTTFSTKRICDKILLFYE